jgi:hypothetical protein
MGFWRGCDWWGSKSSRGDEQVRKKTSKAVLSHPKESGSGGSGRE